MSCVIPFLPLATLLILAVTTRKMAESMIAAPGVVLHPLFLCGYRIYDHCQHRGGKYNHNKNRYAVCCCNGCYFCSWLPGAGVYNVIFSDIHLRVSAGHVSISSYYPIILMEAFF